MIFWCVIVINTYELCPDIEEDFWKLKDFKSTKYNYITYYNEICEVYLLFEFLQIYAQCTL